LAGHSVAHNGVLAIHQLRAAAICADAALAIDPIRFRPIEGGQLNEVH
jgi:hypothetical protein